MLVFLEGNVCNPLDLKGAFSGLFYHGPSGWFKGNVQEPHVNDGNKYAK